MFEKCLALLRYIFDTYIRFCKSTYPMIKYGASLLLGTPLLVGGINLLLYVPLPEDVDFKLMDISYGEVSYISIGTTVVSTILGAILIITGLIIARQKARQTSKVLITSMLEESAEFPDDILTDIEKKDARETIKLGLVEIDDYINQSIKMFNAEEEVNIYSRFILNHNCKKVLLGGRARVPFLVAYGSRFRNISAKIVYFDQLHQNQEWEILNGINENISINYADIESIEANENGDIGLAISFTSEILSNQLPQSIKDHTLMISPSIEPTRNLIKNQENLQKLSHEIKSIIDKLSIKANCKYIHMFLSVQTSVALEIGRNYQEGMHKNFIVHNFDVDKGKYSWRIKICRNKIEIHD